MMGPETFDFLVKIKTESGLSSSGVIIDGKMGLVLTNNHCVEDAGSITVIYRNSMKFSATIIGQSKQPKTHDQESLDLCLLQIHIASPHFLSQVQFSSHRLKEGSTVYTCGFGYFLGLESPSLFKGYVTRIVTDQKRKPLFI
jgi:S1-C subfamily serine protease